MPDRGHSTSLAGSARERIPSADPARILDRAVMLGSVENDLVLLRELAEIFFAEFPGLLAHIRGGIEEQNPELVERNAHTLKGALSNFGAHRACDAARELEICGREARLENAAAQLSTLDAEVAVAANALSDFLREVQHEHSPR